eukprot:CAMPEP_0172551110 /NCGR_PEP_ID=MMETSP1067-20121228/36626_1 /TAXON_ID=265564 ORGANISM="Thalassiosira punctigera, Strain Tpunct2005C2" /NCGR_SAMPLE_ID=MMETSP1067 /ASSEMBLY_ACC=CAM_ASM_000444 /LENGTH=617 /DNA_ID=CAMNT_0013338851 /DNA_START=108 /DNA_END=1961 /DNA_ORIENTATION=+
MKRTLLLSIAAAYAGAQSLRGDGVEEVGEQIENFPSEDFYVHADRRLLIDEDGNEPPEDLVDEWPDQDIVGHIVEDEDLIYVPEYLGEDEEEYDDKAPMVEVADEWSDGDIVVNAVIEDEENYEGWSEDEDGYDEDAPTVKEYARDPDSIILEGTDLMGEAVDQYDRREAACGANKSEFKIMLSTDLYGYETKWKLINGQTNQAIAQGPPQGANYADKSTYSGRWCLAPGQYKFRMIDNGRDGICSNNPIFGCGRLMLFLNGQNAGRMINDKSNWQTKDFPFVVGIASRIDGAGNSNNDSDNGGWCKKVRSVMKLQKGTCTLPNGQRGHRVRVTTKVDKYGKETSWEITRKSGNVVKMKMGPVIEPNQSKSVEDCLPPGKYNYRVQDLDGVCCRHGQGFFKLIVDGKELLNGGSFTKSIDHDFQLGFDWIASMSDRDCEWWYAHDYRRRDWHTRCYKGFYCNKTYRHLKWSPALREDARVYATKLLDTCDNVGIKHDTTDQGENLAKNKGSGNWGAKYPADKVTKRFVDNEEFWGWNRNAHLTQAMWYPSRYIGCAESVKSMGAGRFCRMQVCRYAKAGNCLMGKYNSENGNNWMTPMMMDDSPCGPMCASRDGCYH